MKVMGGILRPECHCVDLVYRPKVFLPSIVCASFPGEAAGYSVDNFSVTSPVGLPGGIVSLRGVGPRRLSVASVISVILSAWVDPPGLEGLGGDAQPG